MQAGGSGEEAARGDKPRALRTAALLPCLGPGGKGGRHWRPCLWLPCGACPPGLAAAAPRAPGHMPRPVPALPGL